MEKKEYKFETLQVRAGQEIDPVSKGTAVPIYQSTAYTFDSMEYGAELFELKRPGNIYTRITNTTNEVFEKRMAALEGGVAAVSTASGQSAVFLSITNICGRGDNIVAQPFLYGGTFTMFAITLRDMGIEVRFAKSDHVSDLEALVDGRTKALFLENIGNPAFNIPDYEPIVEMARRKGICVMVDNTFGMGGYLFRPFEWGCNVSVHSATKWICGHGTALGGVVVDGGNFDWTPEKYPLLAAPSESYHGLIYKEVFGDAAFAGRVRVDGLRNIGPAASPFNSFLMLQGLEDSAVLVELVAALHLALGHDALQQPVSHIPAGVPVKQGAEDRHEGHHHHPGQLRRGVQVRIEHHQHRTHGQRQAAAHHMGLPLLEPDHHRDQKPRLQKKQQSHQARPAENRPPQAVFAFLYQSFLVDRQWGPLLCLDIV